MMKCEICSKPLKDGEKVVPVGGVVVNERRGTRVDTPVSYIHLHHIKSIYNRAQNEANSKGVW